MFHVKGSWGGGVFDKSNILCSLFFDTWEEPIYSDMLSEDSDNCNKTTFKGLHY